MKTLNNTSIQVVDALNQLLADHQVYYQNLRGLHWNVKGTLFFALHTQFESYYNQASETVDELAERILMRTRHALAAWNSTSELALAWLPSLSFRR